MSIASNDPQRRTQAVPQNKNVWSSVEVALNGLRILFTTQRNARVHLLAGLVLIATHWVLPLSAAEWGVLLLCIGMVICLEAMNTAVEITVNLVTRDRHPLAGQAKDVAAGAVLMGVFVALGCWGVICLPKFVQLAGL